jgi:hypothetical protein
VASGSSRLTTRSQLRVCHSTKVPESAFRAFRPSSLKHRTWLQNAGFDREPFRALGGDSVPTPDRLWNASVTCARAAERGTAPIEPNVLARPDCGRWRCL